MTAPQGHGLREELAEAIWNAVDGYMTNVPWERAKANPFQEAKTLGRVDAVLAVLARRGDDTGRVERVLPRIGAGSRIHVVGPDTDYEVVGLDTWEGWAAGSLRLRGTPEHCRCRALDGGRGTQADRDGR